MSVFGDLEQLVRELEVIKARRQERDTYVFGQTLLSTAKSLRDTFRRWSESEVDELTKQARLVNNVTNTPGAKKRLNDLMNELTTIKESRMPEVRDRIQTFIDALETKVLKSPQEVTDLFTANLWPAISLIFRVMSIRESLDSMADMVPR